MDGQMSIFDFPEFLPEGPEKRKAEIIKENAGDRISPAQQYYINTGRTDYWQRRDEYPCHNCGYDKNGCCGYNTKGSYCVLGDKWKPKEKPVCKHSGHSCNKEELWKVAAELDPFCPKVCCRHCNTRMCGARCKGSEEQRDPKLSAPKIPIYHISLSHVWEECPNCHGANRLSVSKYGLNGDYYTEHLSNCPDCGQALLWDWDEIDKKAKKSADVKACEFAGLSGAVNEEDLKKAREQYAKRGN